MQRGIHKQTRLALALAIAAPMTATVHAQAPALEQIIISAERNDIYDVLPDRKSSSVFGTSQSMDEIARSVTLIESDLIDLLGIINVNDFVSITPGSFTGNYFGVPGALDLRGERADNFFRGFRRVENRGNFPTSVMAADFVEVIKGPPPTIYGGGKVGGILNFVPKSSAGKDMQTNRETVAKSTLTYGTYDQRRGSVEYGMPFSIGGKESSVYAFAQLENSNHFYDNIYNKNQILQVAFETKVSDKLSLEYGFMGQDANLNQSLGWNRVTQELIDSEGGRYLSGRPGLYLDTNSNGFLSPNELAPYSLEQFAFRNPFPYFSLSPTRRAAFALDPATVRFTEIDHDIVQTERSDYSSSLVYTGYFDLVWGDAETDGWSIKNQSFYDTMDHQKYSSYGFTADYESMVFENKTTLTGNFTPTEWLALEAVGGYAWRYSDGIEKESRGRGWQMLDRRDISAGATPNDRFEGAQMSGGVPYNWVQDGDFSNGGVFGLLNAHFGERLDVVVGGRWDSYDTDVVGTDINGVNGSASARDEAVSFNASATLMLSRDFNLYATRATSEYLELGQGGMLARETVSAGTWLQDSDLTEFGVKGWLFDRRLFLSLTSYQQKKTSFNKLAQAFDFYESEGIEVEGRFAVTEQLSFTAALTDQETTLLNAPFFLGIPPSVLGLNPAQVYGGRFTGSGAVIGINGPLETPTPGSVYSLNGIYTSSQGWGFSLGATWVDSMYSGFAKAIVLPSYTVARGALFYDGGPYELRLNINNLTDEKYYTPQFLFWDTFISPSVGRTAELTFTYEW